MNNNFNLINEVYEELNFNRFLDASTTSQVTQNVQNLIDQQQNGFQGGILALAIIGIIYTFAFYYYINIRFFNHIIEDIVYIANYKEDESKEFYRPLVYCALNGLPVFVYCLTCVLVSKREDGLMLILGTDSVNIFLSYGLIQFLVILPQKKEGSDIDGWLYLRDLFCYSVGFGLVLVFLYLEQYQWYFGMSMIGYYILYIIVQLQNEVIKAKLYRLVGLTHEDDSFNAEDQFRHKKRRSSITELKYKGLIDKEDTNLQKKIMRMDALLKVNFKDQPKKKEKFAQWHQAVYTVMFAIRNKHKSEKQKRSEDYAKLFAKNDDDSSENNEENNNSQPDVFQKAGQDPKNEDDQLINKDDKPINNEDQNDNNNENQDEEPKNDQNNNDNFSKSMKSKGIDNQSQKDVKPNSYVPDQGGPVDLANINDVPEDANIDNQKFQVSLSLPQGILDKILFIIFFPIHLIIYIMPNYHINPSHRKLTVSFFLNFLIIIGLMVGLHYLLNYSCIGASVRQSSFTLSLVAIFLQLPYFVYNYQFAKKEKDPFDFLLTFIQLGIFKLALCIGIPYLVDGAVNNGPMMTSIHKNSNIVVVIFLGLIVSQFIFSATQLFKANKKVSTYFTICYFGFIIPALVLIT